MTLILKLHQWEFGVIIAVVNIIAAYVVPYVVGTYLSGEVQVIADSVVVLALNLLVVYLSVEEQAAPAVIAAQA